MVDQSEKFRPLVRVSYFSRAILYSVLGLIALTSSGRISQGTDGIFIAIKEFPLGIVILWFMVVGLAAYALFRLASALFDIENYGSDKRGLGVRIGHVGSAVGHVVLAYSAYKFATSSGGGGGDGAQQAAAGILSVTLGGMVLGILGLVFFIAAFSQAKKGVTGSFMNRISADAPSYTRWLGAAGYTARAVVFLVIGWSLVRTGFMSGSTDQIKTLGDAVASLSGEGIVFTLVAIGLLFFGMFSLILARYRIIPDIAMGSKIPSFRS